MLQSSIARSFATQSSTGDKGLPVGGRMKLRMMSHGKYVVDIRSAYLHTSVKNAMSMQFFEIPRS